MVAWPPNDKTYVGEIDPRAYRTKDNELLTALEKITKSKKRDNTEYPVLNALEMFKIAKRALLRYNEDSTGN